MTSNHQNLKTDHRVDRWLRAVRCNGHGFTLWDSTAQRYQELKAIVGGKLLVAPAEPRGDDE